MDYAPWQESQAKVAAPPLPPAAGPQQGHLFEGQASPRVVRMPLREKPAPPKAAGARAKPAVTQPRLFPPQVPSETIAGDSTIYCDAPVALPLHRVMAAAVDATMVLIGIGIFAAMLLLSGADLVLNSATLAVYAAAILLTLMGYRLMWCLADTDSLGMRVCGLRLITFDGMIPDRRQRMQRALAGCISTMAGALGLVWALVDEEKLTWHDHMSKTFPTPAARKMQPLAW